MRHGDFLKVKEDSGIPLESLQPRKIHEYTFGAMPGIEISETYTRAELFDLGAHR
jgi:hypothetical protein